MEYRTGGYHATKKRGAEFRFRSWPWATYMDGQGSAASIEDCDLYLIVSSSSTTNDRTTHLDCISLNKAEFRSWGLTIDYEGVSCKA
jgi:hypothetical protein